MGHQKAAALCLAGETISAEEAERLGLVTKIIPEDDNGFLYNVLKTVRRIAQSPPGALKTTKMLMKQPVLQSLLDANDRECEIFDKERIGSEEAVEAIRQFKVEQEWKRQSKSKL